VQEFEDVFEPPDEVPVWHEPDDLAFERPDDDVVLFHFWLPWDYNVRQFYPVISGGRAFFRFRYMVGAAFQEPVSARAVIFVDGVAAEMDVSDGSTVRVLRSSVVDGLGEVAFSVPAERFPGG